MSLFTLIIFIDQIERTKSIMKIGLDVSGKEVTKQYASIPEAPRLSKSEKAGAARLDITGMYTDVNAYGVHGRTAEDLKKEASNIDVSTVRDYMTVMSNTMSGEDYKKAMEDGFDPGSMDPEARQTVMDHIKAVMAESGQVVAGFNDDLSKEKLKEITGRDIDTDSIKRSLTEADLPDTPDNVKKIGEAVLMMAEIDSLADGSIKYMVENDLTPTVGNIYMSTFSASGDGNRQARGYYGEDMPGYLARKADSVDWETMKPQVEKAVEQMDIEDISEEERLDDARWLLEKGIPVTREKIEELSDIRSIEFPVSARTVVSASIRAIAEGLSPKDANLSPSYKSTYEKAYDLKSKLIGSEIGREEARLKMSIDANIRLIRSGISIDTGSIEDVISALKDEEAKLYESVFGSNKLTDESGIGGQRNTSETAALSTDKKIELFVNTTQVLREIPSMPAALIGRAATEDAGKFTLGRAHSIGTDYKTRYEAASQTYEAVGTEVRKDLGDSITKAFRNVDEILKDLGLDISDGNRRAVRILGYNSMVINEEEIRKIKTADEKLTGVIKALTPGKTLSLIREGINPLDMDVDKLVHHINELDHDPKRESEKYSRFLYKLEKTGSITEEERTSYIGIYRMLNAIERSDHAALGRIIDSDVDMTFGNLLTALRSSHKNIDAGIDDDFGMLKDSVRRGISITEQIETAFISRLPESEAKQLDESYIKENIEQLRQTAAADDAVYSELINGGAEITPDNIIAEEQFLTSQNDLFRNLRAYSRRTDRRSGDSADNRLEDALDKAMVDTVDFLDDKESALKAYKSLTETMTDNLRQMTDIGADTYMDIKSISLMYKQISLATRYAGSENYHIPAMIGGRLTDINLKLEHGSETGLVSATMDTEIFGRVQTQIRLRNEAVEVSFYADNRQSLDALAESGEAFKDRLETLGYGITDVRFLIGDPGRNVKVKAADADKNNEAVSTKALYNIAKEFIQVIRDNDGGNL